MELNSYLFPSPEPTYTAKTLQKLLFYIPHKGDFRKHCYKLKNIKIETTPRNLAATKNPPKPEFRTMEKISPNRINTDSNE